MAGRDCGAARRRRERRLRSAWWHEQLSFAMALAAAAHHSAQPNAAQRGQKPGTRAKEGEVREEHQALRGQTRLPPGMRPALLVEVQPQGCVERHVVEDPSELAPMVQFLDAPVPQMVDTVLEFFRALDLPVGEQVIAVPRISTDRVSQRLVERRLPQMVEQLVHSSSHRGADRWHSSSSAWRKLESSCPSPRTEFNVVALAETHF